MAAHKKVYYDAERAVMVKACSRCGEVKAIDDFRKGGKQTAGSSGLRGRCKDCDKALDKENYAADPEAAKAKQKDYAARHPDRVAARKKRYDTEHHEERLAKYRAYREANRERQRAYDRERHRKETPEMRHAMKLRYWPTYRKHIERRVAMLKAAGDGTKVDREALYERDNYTCYLCGVICTPESITLDHVIPLAKGGPHTVNNLRVACRSCNSRKHARLPNESA